jgi:hypothetical protein
LCFVFSFISPFVLCFPSVSNFYFTSQYHQFPLSHATAAATAAAAAARRRRRRHLGRRRRRRSAARRPKHEKRKQKNVNNTTKTRTNVKHDEKV